MLINVLRGEMSIVGPRCHLVPPSGPLSDQVSLALRDTHLRPGLVNLEDQNGHAGSEPREIEADLFYISNWSCLLDAKILFLKFMSKASYAEKYSRH
jgi:polysaccharide biosynthesis protein PslA